MAQTTPNGTFSLDSHASSTTQPRNYEYYVANSQVVSGYYDIFVNYYKNGSSCTQARAHLLIIDPATYTDSNWHEPYAPVNLDLTNDYTTGCTTFSCMDGYSDWWWAAQTHRLLSGSTLLGNQELPNTGKSINLIFKEKKDLPFSRLNK